MASVVDQVPYNEYTGNGVATVYPYEFQLLDAGDLAVMVDGVEIPSSDYTLSGVGNQAGGDVTFDAAPANLAEILIVRILSLERDTDYQYNGDLREETLDRDFNRLWHALQGEASKIGGSVRAPYPEQFAALPGPTDRALKAITFDADGNLQVVAPGDGTATALAILLADASNPANGDAGVGVKRTITSSVASTQHLWHEKQPYNIAVEGGCVGDDSTDNTTRLQTIITALGLLSASARPTLLVPFGIFRTGKLSIPSDFTVAGFDHNCVLKAKASIGGALIESADTTNGSHRITLRNLCLDGNKASQPSNASGYGSHNIAIEGPCENWVIDHCKVMSSMGHGTQIRGGGPGGTATCTDGVSITNCWYVDCGNFDVGGTNGRESVYANQAQNLIITGNLMEGSGRQTIALEGSTVNAAIATRKVIVANNILRGALLGGGIDDEANTGGDFVFANNIIYDMPGTGIRSLGDTGRKIIIGNVILNVQSRAIDIESQSGFAGASVVIVGNIVDTSGGDAVHVVGGLGVLVQGNTLIACGLVGIYIRNQVATEAGIRVLDNWVNGSIQEGVVIDRPCTAPAVRGNHVVNAGSVTFPSAAISIRTNGTFIEAPNVSDNTVIETRGTPYTTYAFVFSHLNKPVISGNSVQGTTATGDVNFAATQCTNVVLGANQWDWTRVTGTPGWKQHYNGNAALGAIGWDADAAPTLTISSNVITPTTRRAFVGAGLIKTITAPYATGGGTIVLIPTAAFTTDATGNIAIASTAVIGRAMHMTYDSGTTKWYPSY